MATITSELPRPFHLYVTHVEGEGNFLKICGQVDKPSALMLEAMFESAKENLEKGVGAVLPGAIQEGVICAAKYRDGNYYRAKIISTSNIATGLVGVHFIDYGNKDILSLSTLRSLDNYDPMFFQLRGQATDHYLSRVMNPLGTWESALINKIHSLLCYSEFYATLDVQLPNASLISIQFKNNDLSTHLVSIRFCIAIPLSKQEVLLTQMVNENNQTSNWPSSYQVHDSPYSEHVPFLLNQNFPSNPASAMRLQQNVVLPFNGSLPPPSLRLNMNKVARNTVNLRALARQPQHSTAPTLPATIPPQAPPTPEKPLPAPACVSPKKSTTYKSRLLEVNSQHKVFVSYAEEGPELFAVQLTQDAKLLQDMMDDINRRPHKSLTQPPMIGTVCLGRMSGDRIICRAIVMNLSGSQCKLFFVDFGDTEMVSYYDIFDIPEEYVKPNVMAMRFCLSGVKKLEKGPHLNETFKQLVGGKVLYLKVVPPEGPPLIQYGELYLENKMNVLDLLMANMKDQLQFKWMEMLPMGTRQSVLVSYVDSCIKFFIQLSDNIDDLNAVMDAVKYHCENSSSPGELPVGAACCARFPDDGNWYRARVRDTKGNKIIVSYVDYGNEQEVDVSDLRSITPDLIKLPAQAMKCALKGFENKPIETKTSNQLEMLALEKTLMAHIVGVLSNDTILVTLVDESVTPPLDIARKMNQLSQPRSSHEPKVTTPIRKDAPENFSSPEGSVPDESHKKPFRREQSFKDERRPRDGEDFAQRGGSFRGRDKESFDRSGPGRHSEKFAGRPERGERNDRRGGTKPWENRDSAPAQHDSPPQDDWDEGSSQSTFQPRHNQNRDNRDRDRRKPRDHQDKGSRPTWKKDSGPGKRLRQAAEAASADTQNVKGSVQDRLKRNNYQQGDDSNEKRNDDWGNKTGNRYERRDNRDNRENRGDRRDNWGDKKENWNQKRDFQNKGERQDRNQDRNRSNFSPRDRADRSERSFGSDGNKSDRSFGKDDSRVGRAPPFKSRSKFTQVQYKELPDPISLDTPFTEPTVELGAQHEVSVTWIVSPDSFYTQILSLQPKFLDMMHKIPELYKGVKPYTGDIPIGSTVLARYPADGVLYRATVVAIQPFSKFIVRYVDFGNKQLVDVRDIWQMDGSLMELPKMAVYCSLIGVAPKDGEWKADTEIDLCFNAPRYQCVFQECVEDQYKVSLWNNGVSVADMLVEKELAVLSEHQSSVALKDEPIDMTIINEQQIMCRVTYVESFEKFYIQLDLEKAAIVEETIANYDVTKLTPLIPESIVDGIHCTVKHEDKIYRAILMDVSDHGNIKAVLPDYGNTITTSIDKLMILPTELTVYYYQSLQCCLNNCTEESNKLMTLEELKTRLTGNKFIIFINYVEDITLVSTLYDPLTGKKIAIFEPDPESYDEVVPLCMRAVFNYNFGLAYISHAENLNEFYLQKSSDSDKIALLLDDMYKFYEEGTPDELTTFDVDSVCAAKSADGNWYRATILSSDETEVKVQFSDYGNSESVPKESVKKLDSKFYEPCALALVASLGLVALQDDALSKLREWTNDKEVQVTLSCGTDGWLAGLNLEGVDLSLKLINEKLATPQVAAPVQEDIQENPAGEPISLPAGCTQVYISHIDTPGHFWLQMVDKVDKIEEIQAELQTNADSYPDVDNREMGTLCVAKYLADDQWYRAEILDSDADITTVRFTDYGNTDVLDNQPGLIKTMPEHLQELERYAVKSSVNAVPTGTGEWSEAASESFTQLVGDISAPVDALIVLKDVTTYVDIYVNGQNLTDKLVSEGHATRSEEAECGDLPSCFASHVNSPSEFWIQLESATPELQAMEAAMVDAENFPELSAKEEGVICAAKYPEDGQWYRAQVIVNGSEGTEVLFMDYGNASIANELRSLPDDLKVKPALSRKCALQKPRDIKSWSRKSEIKFNELAAEGATIFNVQFIASGDISIVELYLEGKSVTEELVGLCEEHPAAERPTPVGQDLHGNGKICFVQSLDEFYVHFEESLPNVDKVTEALTGAAEFEPTAELKVGSVCAALWSEDEQWYRARVLEFCDVGKHVQFIDYGNKAKCEEFKQLPEELAIIEPLAKCCRLAGVVKDSPIYESGRNKLDELAVEDVTLRIEYLDSTKEPMLVKLLVDGKDLLSTLTIEAPAAELEVENQSSSIETDTIPNATEDIIKAAKVDENVVATETEVTAAKPEQEAVALTDEIQSDQIDKIELSKEKTSSTLSKENDEKIASDIPLEENTSEEIKSITTEVVNKKEISETESISSENKIDCEEFQTANEVEVISKTESIPSEENKTVIEDKEISLTISNPGKKEKVSEEESKTTNEVDVDAAENELLNDSFESCHTVIENKSFDEKDNLSDDVTEECGKDETFSKQNDRSSPTLNNSSNDAIKTIETDDTKDSLQTSDTGYTSSVDKSFEKDQDLTQNTDKTLKEEKNKEILNKTM